MGPTLSNKFYNSLTNPTWLIYHLVVLAFIAGFSVDIDHAIAFFLEIAYGMFLMLYFNMGSYITLVVGLSWQSHVHADMQQLDF